MAFSNSLRPLIVDAQLAVRKLKTRTTGIVVVWSVKRVHPAKVGSLRSNFRKTGRIPFGWPVVDSNRRSDKQRVQ